MAIQDKLLIEERYGPLGGGSILITINGEPYDLVEIAHKLGLDGEDIRPLDVHEVVAERYAVRYFDLEERHIVAYEFDDQFRRLQEIRSHIADWMGDEAYHDFPWGAWCPWSM
jgi:hypothetical protein